MREEFYDDYFELEHRHWWFVGRRAILLKLLDRQLAPRAEGSENGAGRVLDVGCGTGAMLRHLARYGPAEGVDSDERAVGLCRRRGVDAVQLVTSSTLPFADDTFALVTVLDVLEHVDDEQAMLREVRRVMRPDGVLLVTVPAYRFMWGVQDEVSHHVRRYVARELRERVTDAGLELRRLSYFNMALFPVIAAIRLARRLRGRFPDLTSDFEMTKPESRLNGLLARILALEAPLVERVDLPFGVSIVALATKPEPSAPRTANIDVLPG